MTTESVSEKRAGFVAIIGRPNVGKSTLMNRLLGEAIAIATPKAQTTRQQIRGILNLAQGQVVFVDTPGIPIGRLPERKRTFGEFLTGEALQSLASVDVIALVFDGEAGFREEDAGVFELVKKTKSSVSKLIALVNKSDRCKKNPERLMHLLKTISERTDIDDIVPISARTGEGVSDLLDLFLKSLPMGEPLYPKDQLSDRNDRFLAAEMVREQIFLQMKEEIPYSTAVAIEGFEEEDGLIRIHAVIFVERESQKGIVIGAKGQMLKQIGTRARHNLERFFGKKIYLELFVKVLDNWTKDPQKLRQLGYEVES